MGFSVGEDLFSVLVVTGLVAVFMVALAHSYHIYAGRRNASEDFGLALDIAERLRDQVLEGSELENYSRVLALQGISMRVEVRGLEGELLFTHGPKPNPLGRYFSPPVGVGLPAVLGSTPCELLVRVWRD